jgi:hypothetical protein
LIERLTSSQHFDTFIGFFVVTLAIVSALCFVVGVAVVLDAIVGVLR